MDSEISNIAIQLNELVERQLRERLPETLLEDQREEFRWKSEEMIRDAKDLIENYKDEGLTYSSLEAEGYLRGMLTAKNLFDDVFVIPLTNA